MGRQTGLKGSLLLGVGDPQLEQASSLGLVRVFAFVIRGLGSPTRQVPSPTLTCLPPASLATSLSAPHTSAGSYSQDPEGNGFLSCIALAREAV